jgi:Carboxypeptidase regulatory-like domain
MENEKWKMTSQPMIKTSIFAICHLPFFICHFLFIIVPATPGQSPVSTAPAGTVRGVVQDPKGALIPNATIILKSNGVQTRATSTPDGEYEIQVPPGTYEITSEIPAYYPFRRAKFCVESGKIATINVAPPLRVLSVGLEVTPQGYREPVTTAPEPKYEAFTVEGSSCPNVNLLIRYDKRVKQRDHIRFARAIANSGAVTVSADTIRLKPKTLQLEATGNVQVEVGPEKRSSRRVKLNLKSALIEYSPE